MCSNNSITLTNSFPPKEGKYHRIIAKSVKKYPIETCTEMYAVLICMQEDFMSIYSGRHADSETN
jgi:hypothetical protein